ncbi:MAG: hypothetical protein GY854_17410 [Deltaproteobacteria bacterium]|nr:hypothetical protein [Deltaproteobacteria bacterium]
MRQEIKTLEQSLGLTLIQAKEKNLPGVSALASAYADTEGKLKVAHDKLDTLKQERKNTPTRVEIREVAKSAVVKLATERKHLTNVIKMVAYQAESDLLALLAPNYHRAENEAIKFVKQMKKALKRVSVVLDSTAFFHGRDEPPIYGSASG